MRGGHGRRHTRGRLTRPWCDAGASWGGHLRKEREWREAGKGEGREGVSDDDMVWPEGEF